MIELTPEEQSAILEQRAKALAVQQQSDKLAAQAADPAHQALVAQTTLDDVIVRILDLEKRLEALLHVLFAGQVPFNLQAQGPDGEELP